MYEYKMGDCMSRIWYCFKASLVWIHEMSSSHIVFQQHDIFLLRKRRRGCHSAVESHSAIQGEGPLTAEWMTKQNA
jgi:hypothetical protein